MSYKIHLITGSNGEVLPIIQLNDAQDVLSGAQSTPIQGKLVRICATSGAIRFLVGANVTAIATSNYLADQQEIYQPCKVGDVVSVYGGPANVATAGV
jgi:hypothetical protein